MFLAVYIKKDLEPVIRREAERQGKTPSTIAREVITEWLEARR